jgi:hypothetical protein
MRNILSILLILFSANAFSQIHSFGIQSGVNLSNKTGDLYDNSESKLGFIGGFCYEYLFPNNFTLGMDVIYSQKGFTLKSTLDENLNSSLTDFKLNYNYVSLPIKFGYAKGEKLIGFMKVSLCPSILMSTKSDLSIMDESGVSIVDLKEDISKYDLGGAVEVGASYVFINHFELFSSVSYNQSLTMFTNSEKLKDDNFRHYGFSMVMGLKYRFIRNDEL